MLWKSNSQGWDFELYPADTEPSEFGVFASLVRLWSSRAGPNMLPAWKQFDFKEFRGWHGWLALQDVVLEPEVDLYFRLWGTKIVDLHEMELTGKWLSQMKEHLVGDNAMFTPLDLEFIERVVEDRMIGRMKGRITWQDRNYVSYEVLRLPLVDDTQNIVQLLNATWHDRHRRHRSPMDA